jgi:hypothetical protein
MSRNESLLIAASYFWSHALNAFLFGHGPMAPTLADVLLLTVLDISSSDVLFSQRNDKPSHRLKTKNIGGWSGYIAEHKKEGTAGHREHVAFLNMWLEKFVFCGKTFGPTANYQIVAEQLIVGNCIPLGKYLLGAVYHLLHQVAVSLSTNSPIGTPGGLWWFINMWLNLHLRDRLEHNIFTKTPGRPTRWRSNCEAPMYEIWGSYLSFSRAQKNSFSCNRALQKFLPRLQFTIHHLVCI